MNNRKRLDPRDVDLAAQTRNDFTFLKSLQAISNYRDVSFPVTADGLDAIEFIKYINCVLPVLARALWEYDSPNGPLNPKASHRTSSQIGGHPDDVCMKKLMILRDDMRTYLFQNFYSLTQPPPLSGGDTAKWSIALHMWIFILHITCLQFRFAKKTIKVRSQSKEEIVTEYEKYIPGDNDYLTSNNLVTEATVPLCVYSVRTLQTTLMNFIERLCTIAEYSDELDTFNDHLLQRTAEVVIGSGSASVYDAPEWCSSVATAHSNVDEHVANNCNNKLVCTSEFETQTMVWFYTLNLYFVHYYQMASPPDSQALTKRLDDIYNAADIPRVGLDQAKKLCWYPRSELRYYVMEFLCLYTNDCKDDTYQNGMRDYQSQFQFSPEQAVLYRLQQGTVNAKPADVLIAPVPNKSSVSMEYVRVYKWGIPLLECLHRFWNWRYGETRVRSSYMNGNAFNMQLAVLYVINLYFAAHTKIWFKNRFVMYQNDPSFIYNCNKAKSRNYPFIVQTFGYWSVFIPHRADPTRGTFPRNTSMSARRDAAINDDDEESDSGASSEMFYPVPRQPPQKAWLPADFLREVSVAREADAKGADIAIDDLKPEPDPRTVSTETPILKYCRVYDCEDILDAFIVWLIAILHLKNGKIDNKDFSGFICDLFNWPRPSSQ